MIILYTCILILLILIFISTFIHIFVYIHFIYFICDPSIYISYSAIGKCVL